MWVGVFRVSEWVNVKWMNVWKNGVCLCCLVSIDVLVSTTTFVYHAIVRRWGGVVGACEFGGTVRGKLAGFTARVGFWLWYTIERLFPVASVALFFIFNITEDSQLTKCCQM